MQEGGERSMRNFGELNVVVNRRFAGQRIRINTLLDRDIIVHDIEIRESKIKKENEEKKCIYVDIEVDGERRLLWGSYRFMIQQAEQLTSDHFPFKCRIKNDHGYVFE